MPERNESVSELIGVWENPTLYVLVRNGGGVRGVFRSYTAAVKEAERLADEDGSFPANRRLWMNGRLHGRWWFQNGYPWVLYEIYFEKPRD